MRAVQDWRGDLVSGPGSPCLLCHLRGAARAPGSKTASELRSSEHHVLPAEPSPETHNSISKGATSLHRIQPQACAEAQGRLRMWSSRLATV